MNILDEVYEMNNGVKIPKIGLGTWLITGDAARKATIEAINAGYKHIDTAEAYGNENESLEKLGLDYIDLMIIHSPQPWAEYNQSENRYYEGNIEAYKALEEAYKDGKLKAIGVSNFEINDLKNILENCEIKPQVNQVLCHISNTPLELIEYCKKENILIEAYSPIAHGEALKNEKIKMMADKYNVSIPQLCVRYTIQLGTVSLPKTTHKEFMIENSKVNFVISDEDMEILKNFEKLEEYGDASVFPVYGGKL